MFRVKTLSANLKNRQDSKVFNSNPFQKILKAFPRGYFDAVVAQKNANHYDKKFKSYDHLLALIFGQISGVNSLRELETAFNANASSHYHLGTRTIKRSTVSDANQRRDPAVFQSVAESLMKQVSKRQRRGLVPMLALLDSTPIQLKSRGHDWAKAKATTFQTGFKVHVMIDGYDHTPSYVNITDPNVNDVTDALNMPIEPQTLYVFDKGYCSYPLWHRINTTQSHFVTRFKSNAALAVTQSNPLEDSSIISDEVVVFRHKNNRSGHDNPYHGTPLRRVTVQREGKRPIVLATNLMDAPATEVADLYKKRWDIELFFKWLKQNLKVKKFLGESRNAVMLQIYAAIITYLLTWIYRQATGIQTTMHLMLTELKQVLFSREDKNYQTRMRRRRKEAQQLTEDIQHAMAF